MNPIKGLVDGLRSLFLQSGGTSPEERRRLIRVKCSYEVNCIVGSKSFPATVVDMGLNGLRLEVPKRLKQGTTVYVQRPRPSNRFDNEHVMCTVRWCRKKSSSDVLEVGLQYADTPGNMRRSWVKFLLKELGFEERAIYSRRKNVRAPSELPATVRNKEGEKLTGTLINLGVGGALFKSEQAFSPGLSVRVAVGPYQRFSALDLESTVLSTRRTQDGGAYLLSLRFCDLSSKEVRLLGDYVIRLLQDAAD